MTRMLTLIEQAASVDADGRETIWRWSDDADFQTDVDASPSLEAYEGRVNCAGNFERHAFAPGATTGAGRFTAGSIRIDNTDGCCDPLLTTQDACGRRLVIRRGPAGSRNPLDYPIQFIGTARDVSAEGNELVIEPSTRLADLLDQSIQPTLYKGDNVGPDGVGGDASELGGRPKVTLLGGASNVTPAWVNRSRLVLQLDEKLVPGAVTIEGLWDQGAPWTPGVPRGSLDALLDMANAPGANKFDWYDGAGQTFAKLGSPPAGAVTASLGKGALADRTIARIVRSVLMAKGMLDSDVEGVAEMDNLCGEEVGAWIGTDARKTGDVLAELLEGVGGWLIGTRLDRARLGLLQAPAGRPVFRFEEWMIQGDPTIARPADDGDGQPIHCLTYRYDRNFTEQHEGDLNGTGKLRLNWLSQEYRSLPFSAVDLRKRFRRAGEMTVSSLFRSAAAAQKHGGRLAALRQRPWRVIGFHVAPEFAANVDLMDTAAITYPRYGLSGGRLFTVLGIADDFGDRSRAALSTIYGWIEL